MNNKEIFNKAFSCLTPITDNETIYKNVKERAEKMNSKRKISIKKPVSVLLSAALGITAATVTAGAATGWDFNGAFSKIFNNTGSFNERDDSFRAEPFDFEKYYKPMDSTYTFEGFTMNIKGIACDGIAARLIYEIVIDDPSLIPEYQLNEYENGYYSNVTKGLSIFASVIRKNDDNSFVTPINTSPVFNGNTGVGTIGITAPMDGLAGKTLEFYFMFEDVGNPDYFEKATEEVTIDFVEETECIRLSPEADITLTRCSDGKPADLTLHEICISPLSASITVGNGEIYYPNRHHGFEKHEFGITLSDGTYIDFNSYSHIYGLMVNPDEKMVSLPRIFDYGIDISNVTSVTVGDITIPVAHSKREDFDFQKYGKELDLNYNFENYQLHIKGISADRTTAYILYDVIFNENFDYAPKEGWSDWELRAIIDTKEKDGTRTPCNLISVNQNRYSFYGMVSLGHTESTLDGRIITMNFGSLNRGIPSKSQKDGNYYSDSEILECDIAVEIPVDFLLCENVIEKELSEKISLYYYENGTKTSKQCVLKSVSATPFSWEIYVETGRSFGKADCYNADITFNFADGTTLNVPRNDQHIKHIGKSSAYNGIFEEPINPENIVSIIICGTTVPLK